jgi:predicted transcriptional regulator
MEATDSTKLTELAAEIVSAYVSKNSVSVADLQTLIANVHGALQAIPTGETVPLDKPEQKPAVPIKKSVTPDYLISLEDGARYKSLKRHLATKYGLTPQEYREKWGLPNSYPMVAPNYAAARSAMAKSSGLGQKQNEAPAKRSKKAKAA